jgi:hypothetical protein
MPAEKRKGGVKINRGFYFRLNVVINHEPREQVIFDFRLNLFVPTLFCHEYTNKYE